MIRIVLAALLSYSTTVFGQERTLPSFFDTLYSLGNVSITLTYPFDSIHKLQQRDVDALMSVKTANGVLIDEGKVSLNIRGKFRRMTCQMPPLLLNLKKGMLRDLGLNETDEIKLVTHCVPGDEGQENLQEELLCYQLYESLTPYAYRTIWVDIAYCNESEPGACIHSGGILIEPDKMVEHRLQVKEKELYNVTQDSLYFQNYARVAAFNFLIGNRDWSIVANRNTKLFYHDSLGQYIVIPYDFDYANIVGAKYRRENLPEEMIHPFDRIYAGEYYADRTAEILQSFYPFHASFLDTVRKAKNPMTAERRDKLAHYLDHWFTYLQKLNPNKYKYGLVCYYKGGL